MGCKYPAYYGTGRFGYSCFGITSGLVPPTSVTVSTSETNKSTVTSSQDNVASVSSSE